MPSLQLQLHKFTQMLSLQMCKLSCLACDAAWLRASITCSTASCMVTVLNVTVRGDFVIIHARKHHRIGHQPAPECQLNYTAYCGTLELELLKTDLWFKAGLKAASKATGKDSFCLPEESLLVLISIS